MRPTLAKSGVKCKSGSNDDGKVLPGASRQVDSRPAHAGMASFLATRLDGDEVCWRRDGSDTSMYSAASGRHREQYLAVGGIDGLMGCPAIPLCRVAAPVYSWNHAMTDVPIECFLGSETGKSTAYCSRPSCRESRDRYCWSLSYFSFKAH